MSEAAHALHHLATLHPSPLQMSHLSSPLLTPKRKSSWMKLPLSRLRTKYPFGNDCPISSPIGCSVRALQSIKFFHCCSCDHYQSDHDGSGFDARDLETRVSGSPADIVQDGENIFDQGGIPTVDVGHYRIVVQGQ
jgi:hypothetical protein